MEHDWRLDGSGEKLQYVCSRCGAVEHVFHEKIGPAGRRSEPYTVLPDCDEELVRSVLEQ